MTTNAPNAQLDRSPTSLGIGTAVLLGGSLVVLLWFGLAYLLCTTFWEGRAPWLF